MEEHGLFDPSDEIHLFALHYVFIPRINRNLETFRESCNKAPLSTEGNKSPEQLWLTGMFATNFGVNEEPMLINQVL